ncbi:MAG: hypothetical protein M3Q84_03655, partial [Actinomycetota bacterium]|nr:hypothetical protein [Actinomycetota bacterium]
TQGLLDPLAPRADGDPDAGADRHRGTDHVVQPYWTAAHPARAGERRSPAALAAANHHHPVDDRLPDHSFAHVDIAHDDIAHDDIAHDNSPDDTAVHEHTSSDDTTDHEHTAVDDPADDTTNHEHASADFVPDPDGDRSTGLLTSGFSAGR